MIGEAAGQIKSRFDKFFSETEQKKLALNAFPSLDQAFKRAVEISRKNDIILLSPACESFGEFKDYRQRGERFRELVREYSKSSR